MNHLTRLVSLFDGAKKPNSIEQKPAAEFLNLIGSPKLQKRIEMLRGISDEKKAKAFKNKLPAVTWSGVFGHRDADKLVRHSGIICADIDKLNPDQLAELSGRLAADSNVLALFTSPSGKGLKVLFQVDIIDDEVLTDNIQPVKAAHLQFFLAIEKYLYNRHHVALDPSGKDVSRLCYLSCDFDLYVNADAELISNELARQWLTLPDLPKPEKTPAKKPQAGTKIAARNLTNIFDQVYSFTENKKTYTQGGRNEFITLFIINCKETGITADDTLNECLSRFADYESEHPKEITRMVASIYDNAKYVAGKYAKKDTARAASTANHQRQQDQPGEALVIVGIEPVKVNTDVLFWYEHTTEDKNGKEKTEVKFSYDNGIKFLQNNGFAKLPMQDDKYQFIHVQNNIVYLTNESAMREFMLRLLESQDQEYLKVREMFRRGAKQYGATHYLEGLKYIKPNFKRDTRDSAYIYFKNCYVQVTKDSITTHDYSSLNGAIWKKQVIPFEFSAIAKKEAYKAIYADFLQMAILGRDEEHQNYSDADKQKMQAVFTATGYLLHQYKDPANPRTVIAVDKALRQGTSNNGRSGKSMHGKAIGKLIPRCPIDGRNFKWDAPYPFEKLNVDHRLLHFDDVSKKFDFERLYSITTEEFTYSKKYIDAITLPFEDSPKIYISTNFSLQAEGDSALGRQTIIEFSNFFNANHTPQKQFKHLFWTDWDHAEHNRFYNFMIYCIMAYLRQGLVEFPLENYGVNQLIDQASEEFVEFMHDWVNEHGGESNPADMVFNEFKIKNPHFEAMKNRNRFTKWVQTYCQVFNVELNRPTAGERDRRNGVLYWTFDKKKVKP